MTCPVCPAAGWLGGLMGGYIGINPPQHLRERILSSVITGSLITISIVALKVILNISLCRGGIFNLENLFRVGFVSVAMGVIYSIGVNYLLNRFIFLSCHALDKEEHLQREESPEKHCCCKNKDEA